jgi:hypothetical protein
MDRETLDEPDAYAAAGIPRRADEEADARRKPESPAPRR